MLKEAYWARRVYWNVQVNYRVISPSNVKQFLSFHITGVEDGSDVKDGIIAVVTGPLSCPSIYHATKVFFNSRSWVFWGVWTILTIYNFFYIIYSGPSSFRFTQSSKMSFLFTNASDYFFRWTHIQVTFGKRVPTIHTKLDFSMFKLGSFLHY